MNDMDQIERNNYDRVMALTPDKDIAGKTIEVGSKVRCFDAARYDAEHDSLLGLSTTGVCSYMDGTVVSIGPHTPHGWHEGTYYLVELERSVNPVIERTRNDYTVTDRTQTLLVRGQVYILANGTDFPDGSRSFGVVRI